jgi:aminopeptidase N
VKSDCAPGALEYSLILLLILLAAVPAALAGSIRPSVSPADLHRELASGKIRAFERQTSLAAATPSVVDVAGYDATYYRIEMSIDEVAKVVYGQVGMTARARVDNYATPTLHLRNELTVDSVRASGQPAVWSHVSGLLYITLNSSFDTGEEFDITVWYHGRPTTGGLMGFYFGTHNGTPMISTLSEPYMAQSWWPCKDTPSDKADSVDMIVTVNSGFYAVSNGVLRDSLDNGNGTTTYSWHESYPITTYLVSLAITDYARFDLWYHYGPGDLDSMPVRFYSYPERFAEALVSWPITVDQIDFYAETFGEYPFVKEKYGMAHFPWGGAMEHQTVTSATSGDFGFDPYLVAHELSHQWWGDMITCRDWHHIWMNEGFASYCEALWAEHTGGSYAYKNYMDGMAYYADGRVYMDDTTNANEIFDIRVYDKGAWVLHMLRGVIGDDDFFALLRTYYNDPNHQHKDVVTEEFQALAETVSGMDLGSFFAEWVYGYYYPRYAFSWMSEPRSDNFYNIYVHIRQYQSTSPQVFEMPIELLFEGLGGDPVYRVWDTKREQDFVFAVPDVPSSIEFDPDHWILKSLTQETYGLNLVNEEAASGTQYRPYADTLIAKGGTPPYQFVLTSGSLPAGLTLDAATGRITGAPLAAGTTALTFRVWDEGVCKDKALTLEIAGFPYMPGDQNADLALDALDLSALIDYLFAGASAPSPVNAADLNGDCQSDALDLGYLIVLPGGPCRCRAVLSESTPGTDRACILLRLRTM